MRLMGGRRRSPRMVEVEPIESRTADLSNQPFGKTLDPALEIPIIFPHMAYLYVLKLNNDQLYIGFTNNLERRIRSHTNGKVFTTKKYLPIKLIYYECYLSTKDAKERESMLKRYGSTYSHLRKRILNSIKESQGRG